MSDIVESAISIVGSIASVVGIILTYRQVKKVKDVANATKEAAESTQKSILKTVSTVQVTKYCEFISTIQQALTDDEIKLALHLCHELKTVLIELQQSIMSFSKDKEFADISVHIQALGINITNMQKSLPDKKDKLRKTKIIQDLENLHNLMSEIQVKLKLSTQ